MTDPRVGVQSPSEPIVISPIRKTFLSRFPGLPSLPRLQFGRAGSETKITLAASTGAVMRG